MVPCLGGGVGLLMFWGGEVLGSHRSDGKVESIQRSDVFFVGKKDVFAFHVSLFLNFFFGGWMG